MTLRGIQVDIASRLLGSLPLRARRRALRVLWRPGRTARALAAATVGELARTLRLPGREARGLAREIAYHDRLTGIEWLSLLLRSRRGIRADLRHVVAVHGERLDRVAAGGGPVILAPLHMGNYVHGLAWTMFTTFPGRPLLVLLKRHDLAVQTRVMERIRDFGVELHIQQIDDVHGFLPAIRLTRRGAVTVAFADLPPSYGPPADVEMFGRRMRLAVGLDTLARLTGATVVPFAMEALPTGDRLHVGLPFGAPDGENGRAKVVGLVRDHVEAAILARPAQWHLWGRLEEYGRASAGEGATASRPVGAAA